jgi:ATP-dependent exoDNAse (exonuclease V) beta subunit
MPTITVPTTYFEWVKAFDILKAKSDDDAVLVVIRQGTFIWQAGVAERFERKMLEVVNVRINAATDIFRQRFERYWGEEAQIVQALLDLRKEFSFLTQVVSIPCLPANAKEQYREMLRKQAEAIQKAIECSAKADRSGKMISIVGNNKANEF